MIYTLLSFCLITIGASYVWSYGEIFTPIRNFIAKSLGKYSKPFLCGECSSFWIGVLISLFLNPLLTTTYLIISNVFCGLISYGLYKLTHKIIFENE